MKKLAIGLILVATLGLSSCKCGAERKGVEAVEATGVKINAKLLGYVEADTTLDAAAKDDWKKMVESWQRLIDALKNSLK